ncbi:unnamed protein product [Cyclocybe aegerita]|uniref:RNase H type-1 domain-containing protein n=1 Tax=Cyclocybe aegerita TaxID=1973307 RepID=A0A8S0WP16_CYCAE|nr:unnamed protein product [Cyclocybe aegerita]
MTLLSFVDDGTILAQSKQLDDNNVGLRKAYKIIYLLFVAFVLVLEHDKTELFHFSRRRDAYNPSLDLGYAPHTGATPLKPKTYWRGLSPKQRRLLYRSCVVPIATYGYRLWYFDGARNKGAMNQLKWMQRKAALWITGAFRTSPLRLIPVHLMLKKLATRAVYCVATLSDTHPLRSMMGEGLLKRAAPHARSAALMTPAMRGKVKSTVMEVDERVHTLTESFKPFAPEARPAAIIYKGHRELERTHYVSGRVTAPDAELNAISCAVRLAVKQANCQHIMVFTDSMGSAHRAVDPGVHSGQAFSLSVCRALQEWFEVDDLRCITFVYVPSALRWDIHDTLRSQAAHSVLDSWSSTFQDPTYRGSEFLELQRAAATAIVPQWGTLAFNLRTQYY